MRSMIVIAVILSLHTIGFSATIYVPDDFSTIQDAINAAADGDTVIVRPNTYVENIDFLGKDIIVMSEMGPSVTIIDGNNLYYTVTFALGEPSTCTLEGFTITNGLSSMWGGGINVTYSHPTITGSIITGNTVDSQGGGWALGGGIY